MCIAITGADRPMGATLCRKLASDREIIPVGSTEAPGHDLGNAGEYRQADLRIPSATREAVRGADAIVHAQPHDPSCNDGPTGEQELLDLISRGTFVVVNAACEARIGRIVLISQITLMQDYPEDYLVDAHWRAHPKADSYSLAPYLAELVCREVARIGKIEAHCLRMGTLDAADGTTTEDAAKAVEKALHGAGRVQGYGWQQDHVISGGRFAKR